MRRRWLVYLLVAVAAIWWGAPYLFSAAGQLLVVDRPAAKADAIVVLSTGIEYYPRLIHAARLYRDGHAPRIVIDGNRKTDTLRRLERAGYRPCCAWYENSLRILELFDIPRSAVTRISAEDAYDTVSEAAIVGEHLLRAGAASVIVTTSRYHTARAGYIWRTLFQDRLAVSTAAAHDDPFDPQRWWRRGRQIRWVLAEYGGWLFFILKRVAVPLTGDAD